MGMEEKLDIDLFKVVTRAIAQSDNLDLMTDHLSQLLVAALEIKGCSIFALNHETEELEILGSFGLSVNYVNKGPVLTAKSIARTVKGEPIVVSDITRSDLLQYPQEAKAEGVRAISRIASGNRCTEPSWKYGHVSSTLRSDGTLKTMRSAGSSVTVKRPWSFVVYHGFTTPAFW